MEKYIYLVGRNVINNKNGNEIQFEKIEVIKETEKMYKIGQNKEYRGRIYKEELNTINRFERVFCKDLEEGIKAYKSYCLMQLEISQARVKNYEERIKNIKNFTY